MICVARRGNSCWMDAGDRLKAAREAANLSRAQLAERVGYSVSGIGALENGQNNIKPDKARVLAPYSVDTPYFRRTYDA